MLSKSFSPKISGAGGKSEACILHVPHCFRYAILVTHIAYHRLSLNRLESGLLLVPFTGLTGLRH